MVRVPLALGSPWGAWTVLWLHVPVHGTQALLFLPPPTRLSAARLFPAPLCIPTAAGRCLVSFAFSHRLPSAAVPQAAEDVLATTGSADDGDNPQSTEDLTVFVQNLLQQMQGRFATMSDAIIGRIDEMGDRIDELETSIGELMAQAGIEDEEVDQQTDSKP